LDPESGRTGAPGETVGARILITDDRADFTDLVRRTLPDFECVFASTIEQARAMLAVDHFDLLLCDSHSDGVAAREFADEIVQGPRDTAVILLADEDDPELASSAFEFGAYGYLVKPPLAGHLLMTTMNALRRRDLEIAHRETAEKLEVANRDTAQHLEERGQTILDFAPIPIYVKDTSGRYVVANASADEMAGMSRGELVGSTDDSILSSEDAPIGVESDRRVIEEQGPHERTDTVVIDGETKTFKTVRFPLLGEGGEVNAVGGISIDISAEGEAIRLRDELATSQREAIADLKLSRQETIERLTRAIDRHDSSTGQHISRMAATAALLGTELGLEPEHVELLRAAAPMHDVGKIGTPGEILRKPEALTPEERRVMQTHTLIGHEILVDSQSELMRMAAAIALTHHECYDGSGYPQGIAGDSIPIEGRIVAVADVFDALLSDRVYRPALSVDDAVGLLRSGRGSQFDPEILDLLLDHLGEAIALRGDG
jgi:PAS domain S-box-containing protein